MDTEYDHLYDVAERLLHCEECGNSNCALKYCEYTGEYLCEEHYHDRMSRLK
jgi:predicted nucleic acid binding AN1-type Zn finger protein